MLPKPSDGFDWIRLKPGPALFCRPLAPLARHFFTTRGWPLGSGDGADRTSGWLAVADAAGVGPDELVRLQQVHAADVVVHRRGSRVGTLPPPADIVVTDDPDVAVAIQAADCVPLLVADRCGGGVAAAHAGWRGLAARVPAETVAALARAFGSRPRDLVAAIGPSIGACCYEVGEDVYASFVNGFGATDADRWFRNAPLVLAGNPSMAGVTAGRPGKFFFDVWRATADQLEAAGVPADRIHAAALCTASHPDILCSYRRDADAAGRIAAVVRATRAAAEPG